MKNIMIIFVCFLFVFNQANADEKNEIKVVNAKVSQIDNIKDSLNILELNIHAGEMEASPPSVLYYYKPDNFELVIMQVDVGHEIYSVKHVYYFENNKVLKYLKETHGHPDSPPKQAVIYKSDGSVAWKNVEEPVVNGESVIELFKKNINVMKVFSKY